MAKRAKKAALMPVIESSGNVFADLQLPEPEEELAKAKLASHIRHTVQQRRLTQVQAARVMGLDQPKVSALMNGRLEGFPSDRLMRLLTALGQDVDIVVRRKARRRERSPIRLLDMA